MSQYLAISKYTDSDPGRHSSSRRGSDLLDLRSQMRDSSNLLSKRAKAADISTNPDQVIHIDAKAVRRPIWANDLRAGLKVYLEHKLAFLKPISSTVSVLV